MDINIVDKREKKNLVLGMNLKDRMKREGASEGVQKEYMEHDSEHNPIEGLECKKRSRQSSDSSKGLR